MKTFIKLEKLAISFIKSSLEFLVFHMHMSVKQYWSIYLT